MCRNSHFLLIYGILFLWHHKRRSYGGWILYCNFIVVGEVKSLDQIEHWDIFKILWCFRYWSPIVFKFCWFLCDINIYPNTYDELKELNPKKLQEILEPSVMYNGNANLRKAKELKMELYEKSTLTSTTLHTRFKLYFPFRKIQSKRFRRNK